MTTLLTFSVQAKPVKEGQWCRVKRGQLKGDLVKVKNKKISIFDDNNNVIIILILFNF